MAAARIASVLVLCCSAYDRVVATDRDGPAEQVTKFKVAIEALQGDRVIAEIAAEYGVHPQQIRDWKRQLLDKGADVF